MYIQTIRVHSFTTKIVRGSYWYVFDQNLKIPDFSTCLFLIFVTSLRNCLPSWETIFFEVILLEILCSASFDFLHLSTNFIAESVCYCYLFIGTRTTKLILRLLVIVIVLQFLQHINKILNDNGYDDGYIGLRGAICWLSTYLPICLPDDVRARTSF